MFSKGSSYYRGLTLAAATLAAAGSFALAGVASADTILYSDNFVQASGTVLNGQTVQTSLGAAGATANATWTGDTGITTDGSGNVNVGSNESIYLPFTPQSGHVYTLTMTMNSVVNYGVWAALGFSYGAPTGEWDNTAIPAGDPNAGSNNASDWVFEYSFGSQPRYYSGTVTPDPNGGNGFGPTISNTVPNTFIITLDTTQAAWVGTAEVQGYTGPTNTISWTYTTNPSITDVGFGTSGANATVSGFSLTASNVTGGNVPEPASLGLMAVAGSALLLVKRRKTV